MPALSGPVRTSFTGYSKPADSGSQGLFGDQSRLVEESIERHRGERAATLSLLVDLHKQLGPLAPQALAHVAQRLGLPIDALEALARAHRLSVPVAESVPNGSRLGLCSNAACAARGGSEVERVLREKGIEFEPLRCQGACDLGPIACYHRGPPLAISAARARSLAKADPADWEDILSVEKPVHAFKTDVRVAFANIFAKGSQQLATARRHGVWGPVESALRSAPEKVLEAVEASGLVGGEPDGRPVSEQWKAVRAAQGPRILVINGLESEPGTSKDRVLLERDPHLVLSGALLCAWAIGAEEAFLCLRADYELVAERCRTAIDDATRSGLLGEAVLGTSFSLPVRLRFGPSSYFAAEPARLIEALEGRPPAPPSTLAAPELSGLFGRPTLVQNVETLATLPLIVANGGDWYRGLGLGGDAGTKIVSLGGDVKRPGNYEVPRGTPLRQLVEGLGEGPLQGKRVVALQVGSAASPYLPGDQLDLPLSDAALAPFGASIGSGSVIAITEKSCLFDLARREAAFFARESCGACEPCGKGLSTLANALERVGPEPVDLAGLESSTAMLREAGCRLGRRAAGPFASLLRHFPDALEEHRSGVCVCFPKRKSKT